MEGRLGKESGGSASPPSSLSDNSKVSSSPSLEVTRHAAKAHQRAVDASGSSLQGADLASRLALAEADLQAHPRSSEGLQEADLASRLALAEQVLRDHSGPSSTADSEERDTLHLIGEEHERRSNAGSLVGSDAATPKDGGRKGSASSGEDRLRPHPNIRELLAASFPSDKSGSGSSVSHERSGRFNEDDPKSSSSSSTTHRTNMELWELLLNQQKEKNKAEDTVTDLRNEMAHIAEKHGMEMEAMQRQLRKTLDREIGRSEENMTEVAAIEEKNSEKTLELKAMSKALTEVKKQYEEEKGDLKDWVAGQEARANARIKNMKMEFTAKLEEEKRKEEEARKAKEDSKAELSAHNAMLEKELVSTKVASKNAADERDVLRRNLAAMQASHNQHVNSLKEQLEMAQLQLRKDGQTLPRAEVGRVNSVEAETGTPSSRSSESSPSSSSVDKVGDVREQLAAAMQREKHKEMTGELSEFRVQMLGAKQQSKEVPEASPTAAPETKEKAVKPEPELSPKTTPGQSAPSAPAPGQVGDLQMLLEAADVRLSDLSFEGVGAKSSGSLKLMPHRAKLMKARARGLNVMKLTAIDEDDMSSMDGSAAASGNVSSDGGDEVGDLHDFDENVMMFIDQDQTTQVVKQVVQQKMELKSKVEELKEKLAEDHIAVDEAKEELAEKEARHASKVARLMDVVESAKASKASAEQELENLKADLKSKEAEHGVQMKEMQEKLATVQQKLATVQEQGLQGEASRHIPAMPSSSEANDQVCETLRQQLCGALEAKRIAESRAEEFKWAMASMERQHNDIVAELKQQLLVAGSARSTSGSAVSESLASASEELEDLRQQLRTSVEERNVLANSMEWKEVQWKSKVENMEMNHSASVGDLNRRHETEVKELTLRLEGELTEVRQRLEQAQKECAKLEEKVREQTVPELPPSIFSRLRCPTRGLPGSSSGPADSAAYCQDVCWRILNTIQGVTALFCNSNDYKILQATRTAHMTWGSAALHGQSVLTLVNGPSRAAWLRKAFQMHRNIADTQNEGVPGFVVRDLGCEEFTSKGGQVFDSSVITAHLPAEPRCKKEAALLIIIEPQNQQQGQQQQQQAAPTAAASSVAHQPTQQPVGRVEAARGNQSSAHSEVSTVDPSDSASNIFSRNMGMLSMGQR